MASARADATLVVVPGTLVYRLFLNCYLLLLSPIPCTALPVPAVLADDLPGPLSKAHSPVFIATFFYITYISVSVMTPRFLLYLFLFLAFFFIQVRFDDYFFFWNLRFYLFGIMF